MAGGGGGSATYSPRQRLSVKYRAVQGGTVQRTRGLGGGPAREYRISGGWHRVREGAALTGQ